MHDNESLIAKAAALGEALASHVSVRTYFGAQKAVRDDREAQDLLTGYQTQMSYIRDLEAAGRPVEPSDKQKLRDFETRMASHDKLKALMRAQTDYVDLMNRINQAMDEPLGALARQEPGT
jgi:cell fate (sporulation/competence/biofilm development) regulator YlbF (YheA/YmcA/DUF963 family)